MFQKFAKSVVSSEKLSNWFLPNLNSLEMSLRSCNTFFHPKCRTERFKRSAINTIIRAANSSNEFVIVYEDD